MSIPVNITPALAFDVATLPYLLDQDISEAPTGIGNAPCTGTPYNAVWFKFTPAAGITFVYVSADWAPGADTGTFTPACSVWTGTPSALTAYVISEFGISEFCSQLVGGFYFRMPVVPGTTYYLQVTQDAAAPITSGALLRMQVFEPHKAAAPAGSPVITDDADAFPAMVLGETTGQFLRAVKCAAGEYADTNPGGYYCVQNGAEGVGVAFLNSQMVEIAAVSFWPSVLLLIKSDHNGNFYIATYTSPGPVTVHKYTQLGVLVWSKVLPDAFNVTTVAAVSQDGVHIYCGSVTEANTGLLVYNFSTNTQEADLAVGTASESFDGYGDGFALASGTLVFMKTHTVTHAIRIVMYNPSTGAQVATWTPAVSTFTKHYCYYDETSLMLWGYLFPETTNHAIMERVNLVNGATLSSPGGIPVSDTSTISRDANNPNAISDSCPVFVLTAPLLLSGTEVTEDIRCLRRFPLPFDRSLWIYVSRIEFLIQAGMGLPPETGQGDDPLITVRFSGDGGNTWHNIVQLSAGKQGQFQLRPVLNRIGKLQNGVCEFIVSDPVYSYLLDAFIDAEESTAG